MKILILRFSSMGDILLATPVLDVLKKSFPDSSIDWVVNKKFEDSIKSNPHISRIFSFSDKSGLNSIKAELDSIKYDFIFDLHNNSKTFYLTRFKKNVFRYRKRVFDRLLLVMFKKKYREIIPATKMYFAALEKAGIKTPEDWKLSYHPDPESESAVLNNYSLKMEPYIVFVPGASYFTKMWPKEHYKELSELIFKGNIKSKIIIIGRGVQEEAIGNYICSGSTGDCTDLTGKLSLDETAVVLKYADFVVTNDNGPMHLAECFGKKIVAIFGCTTEEFGFFPYSTNLKVIENRDLKCRPCTHFGRKKCPEGHFRCMRDITPGSVYKVIVDYLK